MRKSVALAALGLVALVLTAVSYGSASAATYNVDIGNLWFCSEAFDNGTCTTPLVAGDTVTWTNVAGFHTVTQCDSTHTDCGRAGDFDSGQMEPGAVFSRTFDAVGDYFYYCAFHPSQMFGIISVAAPTPSPSPVPVPTDGATAAPAAATTAAAVTVPKTGGAPLEHGLGLTTYALFGVGLALMATSGFAFASIRRD